MSSIFMKYKYFSVVRLDREHGRKTDVFLIDAGNGEHLGRIAWYSHWRQFAFQPFTSTIWSTGCLKNVEDAIAKITADYEAQKSR